MPNSLSVEIYVPKQSVLDILQNPDVTHILVQGEVTIDTETGCTWNIEANGYPLLGVSDEPACPKPC